MYEWFDPFEAKAVADAAPAKISAARSGGFSEGQSAAFQVLNGPFGRALEDGVYALGRAAMDSPEVKEAVRLVADGLRANGNISRVTKSMEWDRSVHTIQEFQCRAFRVTTAVRVSRNDLEEVHFRRAY